MLQEGELVGFVQADELGEEEGDLLLLHKQYQFENDKGLHEKSHAPVLLVNKQEVHDQADVVVIGDGFFVLDGFNQILD